MKPRRRIIILELTKVSRGHFSLGSSGKHSNAGSPSLAQLPSMDRPISQGVETSSNSQQQLLSLLDTGRTPPTPTPIDDYLLYITEASTIELGLFTTPDIKM